VRAFFISSRRQELALVSLRVIKKAKTSTSLMFLKGFGPDQCEEDVAKQLSISSFN
jgi:hypothetical protein